MNKIITLLFLFISSLCWAQLDVQTESKNEKSIKTIGDIIQLALPVAAGASTIILWDKEGAWQFVKSYGTTLALTYGLKYLINKPRPNGATDGHAFPSGHTASAFSGASFIQRRYGWVYGAPAYALAGFCAYSRLQGNNPRHDGWDVAAGAIVGIGSTYLFTTPYQKEHYELSFSSGDNQYLLGMKYKF
jgi:membrane-associated phospholipid phosphatase